MGVRTTTPVAAAPGTVGFDRRHVHGAVAEFVAAALLVFKGYRIVARRYQSRRGEIDLIAVRGRRLAFVEVKYRQTIDQAASSITAVQALRIANSAEQWMWAHPRYHGYELGLDAILLAPRCRPRHAMNALQPA
jgi:putative endonuclease